jgi:hypothetical protein
MQFIDAKTVISRDEHFRPAAFVPFNLHANRDGAELGSIVGGKAAIRHCYCEFPESTLLRSSAPTLRPRIV